MSHGVHAVQHEVEHQIEHEATRPRRRAQGRPTPANNRKIALLIAVIALFLAFSETSAKARRRSASSSTSKPPNL